ATVIIPEENERDLVDIPKNIKQNLDIRPVRWIDEVLQVALKEMPQPKEGKSADATPTKSGQQQDGDEVKKRGAPTKH
ncbi:MAG: S16 family serine protease, partial [Candidatus Thiodiazotropha endolucinida]